MISECHLLTLWTCHFSPLRSQWATYLHLLQCRHLAIILPLVSTWNWVEIHTQTPKISLCWCVKPSAYGRDAGTTSSSGQTQDKKHWSDKFGKRSITLAFNKKNTIGNHFFFFWSSSHKYLSARSIQHYWEKSCFIVISTLMNEKYSMIFYIVFAKFYLSDRLLYRTVYKQ